MVGADISHGALEHRDAVTRAGVWEIMVCDENVRVLNALGFKADRNVRIAIEVVHYINDVCVGPSHAVHDHADKVAALHIHIPVEHHKGEEVVCGRAHVTVEDYTDILLLVICPDVDALGGNIHRMLAVVPGELDGCSQAVFREYAVGVEVVLSVLGVVPSAYKALMLTCMLDNSRDAFAVETVLGGDIGNHQPLRRLTHRIDINGKAIGVHLPHSPYGVVELRVREVGI